MVQSDSAAVTAAGYKILSKEILSDVTKLMVVEVPRLPPRQRLDNLLLSVSMKRVNAYADHSGL